jgi:hypothetical protein
MLLIVQDIKPEFKRQTLGQQTYSQQDIKNLKMMFLI